MYRFFIILLIIPLYSQAQFFKPDHIEFEGRIYSAKDSAILNDVHVINMNMKKVTATFHEGNFYIPVKEGDQLLFSSIGYRLQELIITDSLIEAKEPVSIYLEEQIYQLDVIEIWPYQTYAQFKQAFMDYEPEEEIEVELPKAVRYHDFQPGELGKISISGPITALYMAFSKEGKSIKKYNQLIEEDSYQKLISWKYNRDIVQTVTGIEDEQELEEFLAYCDLSDDFVLNSIDYEIFLAIKDCYIAYLNIN